MKTELLKIIKKSMDKQNVNSLSYPSVDKLCLKTYPNIVYENKLASLISGLLDDGLIQKSEKGGIMLTEKGLNYLIEH